MTLHSSGIYGVYEIGCNYINTFKSVTLVFDTYLTPLILPTGIRQAF